MQIILGIIIGIPTGYLLGVSIRDERQWLLFVSLMLIYSTGFVWGAIAYSEFLKTL